MIIHLLKIRFFLEIFLSRVANGILVLQAEIEPMLPALQVQFSSVAQLCLTLCNPMDCSTRLAEITGPSGKSLKIRFLCRERMRRLDDIADSMNMSLRRLQELVKAWHTAVPRVAESDTTERLK